MIRFVSDHYGVSGLITLAVVVSLIEFGVVLDGVGMAMQPLIGTYFGEKNHILIRRVMKSGVKAAIIEGAIATIFIWIFARQFCGLFGITAGEALAPSIMALRIISLGFVFCSVVSLTTSYYMLIDRIGMAACIACLQNGVLYIILPILGSFTFGFNGMWTGFVLAPIVTLITSYVFIYCRFGKDNFPFLLKDIESEIVVMDESLTPETAANLSKDVETSFIDHDYSVSVAERASLFVEEIGLTVLEMNKESNKPVLIELSIFFEPESAFIIERDSGVLFDLTDPDVEIKGLSGFVLSGLMSAQKEKAYLVTTGYNRNMIRLSR